MDGHQYEYVVADFLKAKGYHGVKVTKGSGDFGVDVIATKHGAKYAVQCKLYSSPVGVSAVQEVVAGKAYYGCTEAMVVTNSTFTAAAEKLAKSNGVILIDGVSPTGSHKSKTIRRVLLYLLWLGIAGGILTNGWDTIDDVPDYVIVLLVTLPLWIKPLCLLLTKVVKAIIKLFKSHRKKTQKPVVEPVPSPAVTYQVEDLQAAAKEFVDSKQNSGVAEAIDSDLLTKVIAYVVYNNSCTISQIQRKFRLGYNSASSVVDALEAIGIVGPYEGSKPRVVLITPAMLSSKKENVPFS